MLAVILLSARARHNTGFIGEADGREASSRLAVRTLWPAEFVVFAKEYHVARLLRRLAGVVAMVAKEVIMNVVQRPEQVQTDTARPKIAWSDAIWPLFIVGLGLPLTLAWAGGLAWFVWSLFSAMWT